MHKNHWEILMLLFFSESWNKTSSIQFMYNSSQGLSVFCYSIIS